MRAHLSHTSLRTRLPEPTAHRLARALVLLAALLVGLGRATEARADDLGPVPVGAADPSTGSATAPVTIVYFGDYQCPFCGKAMATLAELRKLYGEPKLRIVYKHFPLAMHKDAGPAAELGVAVHQAGGNRAFAIFHEGAFEALRTGSYDELLGRAGVTRAAVDRVLKTGAPAQKVAADLALAAQLGLTGTPSFLVNGRVFTGAQPTAKFAELIDAELAAGAELLRAGVAPGRLYVELAKKNFVPPAARAAAAPAKPAAAPAASTVQLVPIGSSPTKGSPAAPVTIVIFSDFQCPYCSKVVPTLAALEKKYGASLRFVFKHNPLPFHARAEPAAELALEVRARKGDAAFWTAHDRLFAQQNALEDTDLEQLARDLGLDPKTAMAAVTARKHAAAIEADQDLADDAGATGTPSFFVNGRKIAGAQRLEAFEALVDEELAHAAALQKKGVPATQIYAEIMKGAQAPAGATKVSVPPPRADSPVRGAKTAPVTVQMFGDFQCPFCAKVQATLTELEKAYPGQLRIVWRNFPLAFHHAARPAAAAALEARRQKGDAAFWQMHDLLYAHQDALDRASLLDLGKQLGLNETELAAALDGTRFDATIEADLTDGKAAGVAGTPAAFVNGYPVRGAQPLATFKRAVRRALADLKRGKP
ncbi:MAG: thioredoxin domain-containing protein [Polyangiaceae bacterium]|nr:thioredoxin domain-containing protein [Polyangiaceae bacterium]